MPKKSSRRNTLSSLDLENFLSEVTASDDQIKSNRRNTLSSDEILLKKLDQDDIFNRTHIKDNENINPNVAVSDMDLGNIIIKPLLEKKTITESNSNFPSQNKTAEDRSNEEIIREFCKVNFLCNKTIYIKAMK